ncbi:MAG TPA: cupin domain-containing protein [Candidatus Anoxymicrobiaceae bacterium]
MSEDKAADRERLKAKMLDAEALVAYQEGSVVSREIVRSDAGTVSIFAFDDGEGLSEHTAPFDALVHVIDGSVEVSVAGEPILLEKGQMVIMPAGKPHALKALGRFKMVLTLIKK